MRKAKIVDKYWGLIPNGGDTVFIQISEFGDLGDAIRVAKRMRPDKIEICLELNKGEEF